VTRSDNPLWDLICQTVKDAFISTKAGVTVAGATAATGIGTALDWLPENVGWIASLAGLSLTAILSWAAIRRMKHESEERLESAARFKIDMELARQELAKGI